MRQWSCGFHKIRRDCWLAEELVASQEERCSMEVTPDKYHEAWNHISFPHWTITSLSYTQMSSAPCYSNTSRVFTTSEPEPISVRQFNNRYIYGPSVLVFKGYLQKVSQDYRPSSRVWKPPITNWDQSSTAERFNAYFWDCWVAGIGGLIPTGARISVCCGWSVFILMSSTEFVWVNWVCSYATVSPYRGKRVGIKSNNKILINM